MKNDFHVSHAHPPLLRVIYIIYMYSARGAVMREDELRESNNMRELNERFFLFSAHTPRHRGSHFFMMYTTTLLALGICRVS